MRTNEEKLDLFADILEPAANILTDKEVCELWLDKQYLKAIRAAIKLHKSEVLEVLAAIDGVPTDEYKLSGLALLVKLTALINDKDTKKIIDGVFTYQGQTDDGASSGPATANTEGGAE